MLLRVEANNRFCKKTDNMSYIWLQSPQSKTDVHIQFLSLEIFGLYFFKFPTCETESFRMCCYGLWSLIKKTIVLSLLFCFMNTVLVTDDDTASEDGNGDLSRDENKWALAPRLTSTQTIVKLDQQTFE
jgi:hypothetical protein